MRCWVMAPNPKLHQNSPELPPIGMVRVAALVPVPALLAEFGHDPEAVLGPFGITKKLLSDSQNVLPFADTGRALEHCAIVTNVPHFGLLTGDRENLSMLGVLGLIMFNARTIGEALAALSEHFVLHNRWRRYRVQEPRWNWGFCTHPAGSAYARILTHTRSSDGRCG